MQMLLNQSRQQAVIIAFVGMNKFQKDFPGDIDGIFSQCIKYALTMCLLVDSGSEVCTQLVNGRLFKALCCHKQVFQLRRRMIEFVFRWYFYVVQFLSVAVVLPHMAEFCAVLHQALDVPIITQKISKFLI